MQNPVQSLIMLTDQSEHLRRRKSWNRGLNTSSLKELRPMLASRVEQLVESVANQAGAVDLAQWASFFT